MSDSGGKPWKKGCAIGCAVPLLLFIVFLANLDTTPPAARNRKKPIKTNAKPIAMETPTQVPDKVDKSSFSHQGRSYQTTFNLTRVEKAYHLEFVGKGETRKYTLKGAEMNRVRGGYLKVKTQVKRLNKKNWLGKYLEVWGDLEDGLLLTPLYDRETGQRLVWFAAGPESGGVTLEVVCSGEGLNAEDFERTLFLYE